MTSADCEPIEAAIAAHPNADVLLAHFPGALRSVLIAALIQDAARLGSTDAAVQAAIDWHTPCDPPVVEVWS